MTLISNGPVSSFAADSQGKSFKPESPPVSETEGNRFKDNLNKAIAEETEVSENRKKMSAKNTETESRKISKDSVREPSEGKKKSSVGKQSAADKNSVKMDVPEGVENSTTKLSTLMPMLNSDEGKKNSSRDQQGDIISIKKSVKKNHSDLKISKTATEAETDEQNLDTNVLAGDKVEADKTASLMNLESEKDFSDAADHENDVTDEAQIIPFPSSAKTEVTSQIVAAEGKAVSKDDSTKVSGKSDKNGKSEPVLSVIDTRSGEKSEINKTDIVSKTAAVTDQVEQNAKESNQIVLGEQNVEKAGIEDAKSFTSRLSDQKDIPLARELKDSGNDQIVKKASIILKDNNHGEIKLILKPESLGRVKIHLNMSENNLVGKIIVENSRVGHIFENNLNDLSKSFEEAGISSSSIEVSVGDENKQGGDQNQSFQNDQPFYSGRLKTLDEAVPGMNRDGSDNRQLVNLVV